jgi:hypothetical protein
VLDGVGGQHHAPVAIPSGKDPVPVVQEAGWAAGPVWNVAENLSHPGFDPRTVQPVASRYTGCVITAPYDGQHTWSIYRFMLSMQLMFKLYKK